MKNVDFKIVDSLLGFDCNLLQLPGRSYDQCFNKHKHPVFLISLAWPPPRKAPKIVAGRLFAV
jgi:hypothetical protein